MDKFLDKHIAKISRVTKRDGRTATETEGAGDLHPRSRRLIAVFGSSQPRRGDGLFAEGRVMGETLANAGFDVMTGGYRGVMEAVSEGAKDAGAHVVGITMNRFSDNVNRFVMDEIRTTNFYERFGWLVDRADGYVAMHGGIGTLAEVTFAWQELLLGMVPRRPLVLVGQAWRAMFECWKEHLVPTPDIFKPLKLADSPAEAVAFLTEWFERAASAAPIHSCD